MPREDFRIERKPDKAIVRIQKHIQNPEPLMKQLGAFMLADTKRAFREQRLGELAWPHRYPNQVGNFINVAGAVQDLQTGARIHPRRFLRRPALVDRGTLRATLNSDRKAMNVRQFEVFVGTTDPKAAMHQWGSARLGPSKQRITSTVKENLAKVMKRERRAAKRARGKGVLEFARARERVSQLSRLGYLFQRDTLETNVVQRPFLGITEQAERKMIAFLERKFGGK